VLLPNAGSLYKCVIPLSAGVSAPVRVFLWHVSHLDDGVVFDLRLSLSAAATGTAQSIRSSTRNVAETSDISVPGICLADIQLYRGFDDSAPDATLGSNESVVWTATVDNGRLIGALIEFDVRATTVCNLQLRTTFLMPGSTLPPWADDAVDEHDPPDNHGVRHVHVRGWWPRTAILMPVTTVLDLNPWGTAGSVECPIEEVTNPPELSAAGFQWQGQTADPFGFDNKGLYGADVSYEFGVTNTDPISSHAAYLRIFPRNSGGQYWGAGKIAMPMGYPDQRIPKLNYASSSTGDFTPGNPGQPIPVIVPPNTTVPIAIRVANAVGGGQRYPSTSSS